MNISRIFQAFLAILLLFALCNGTAAQQCTRPAPPGQSPNMQPRQQSILVRTSDLEILDKMARGTYGHAMDIPGKQHDLAIERRHKLQQQVVTQSARLLVLAQQLNTDATASSAHLLPASAVKEAAQIEKLAKSIKEKTLNAR